MKSGLSFLIAARECEIVELDQLSRTSSLVSLLGHLIHVLQKERGRSNLYLSSGGKRGHNNLVDQINECLQIEQETRAAFDHLDTGDAKLGNGARLFGRIAYVLQGLDALPRLRERVAGLEISPEESTASFVRLISGLLAVVFEAADTATNPEISRLLVAMFNFMEGKEFAGQERATGVAAFGSGVADMASKQHWLDLIDSQERCFQIFVEFSPPGPLASWFACTSGETMAELERLRRIGCTASPGAPLDTELSQAWFDCCTDRMDAMHQVEAQLAASLLDLCKRKIDEAAALLSTDRTLLDQREDPPAFDFFGDYTGEQSAARPLQTYGRHVERSVLELVQEQSQRMQAMRDELDKVRASLNERKVVERAKGLLMAHRNLTESDAHKMLRQTAMSQNRKLVEVAESVLAMSELLPHQAAASRT